MVIDNMRFTQLPDGRIEVEFQCDKCKKFFYFPYTVFERRPFGHVFMCSKCWDQHKEERQRVEEERLRNRSWWQKFRDFWLG